MILRRAFLRWSTLLAVLTGSIASAQEQTARLLRDVNRQPGEYRAGIDWIMPVEKGAVFPRYTFENGSELWTSNGSPIGTRILKELVPGRDGSTLESPVAFTTGTGAKVAFSSSRMTTGDELWVTDGTDAGTVCVFKTETIDDGNALSAQAGTTGGVFFTKFIPLGSSYHDELHFSDGTAAGTRVLNPYTAGFTPWFTFPHSYVTSGQWCYFIANRDEIWRSDGTVDGTAKMTKLWGALPEGLAIAGGRLFVAMDSSWGGVELWACPLDGGDLTQVGPPADTEWDRINTMVAAGDQLFFQIEGEWVPELWACDGTTEGTRQVPVGFDPEADWYFYEQIAAWDGAVYLQIQKNGVLDLWRVDGTPDGSKVVASFPSGNVYISFFEGASSEDYFYFQVSDGDNRQQLWRTKGSRASTHRVRGAPTSSAYTMGPHFAESKSGEFFFTAEQGTGKESVWRLSGKSGGAVRLTRPVKSTGTGVALASRNGVPYEMLGGDLLAFVNTGNDHELWRMKPDGSRARSVWKSPPLDRYDSSLAFHGTNSRGAIFTLENGYGLRQVWFTDGTPRGTRMLGDYGQDKDNLYPDGFVQVGDSWFFSVTDSWLPSGKAGIWVTDGTPDGTSRVVAANGSVPGADYAGLVAFEDGVAFLATRADGKPELWRSDGTPAGTLLLKNEWYGQPGERAACLSVVGGKLHFAVSLEGKNWLWQSDGTAAGTSAVSPAVDFVGYGMTPAIDLGGAAIFRASQMWPHARWWRHDASGTFDLQGPAIGQHLDSLFAYSRDQAVAGSQIFYSGNLNSETELWVTDGTSAGTRQVADLNPGPWPRSSEPKEMLAVGDVIYFSALDREHGYELWRSDGTSAGTVLVADIEPGAEGSMPRGLKVMDGKLYFSAYHHETGREIFMIDLPAQ